MSSKNLHFQDTGLTSIERVIKSKLTTDIFYTCNIYAKNIILTDSKLYDLFFLLIFSIFPILFHRILILGWKFEVPILIFVYFFMTNLKAL